MIDDGFGNTAPHNKQFIDLFPQRLYALFWPLAARPVRNLFETCSQITVVFQFSPSLELSRPSSRASPIMTAPQTTSASYEVGYRKPPRSTQFQKGQSGNPGGRPRRLAAERLEELA